MLRSDARALFDGLTSGGGLAMVLAVRRRRRRDARRWSAPSATAPPASTAALAVVAIVVGWALAQDPYLLPPSLTLDEAAAADATLQATIIVVGIGLLVLGPSLWFLYRLVLRGSSTRPTSPSTSASSP